MCDLVSWISQYEFLEMFGQLDVLLAGRAYEWIIMQVVATMREHDDGREASEGKSIVFLTIQVGCV